MLYLIAQARQYLEDSEAGTDLHAFFQPQPLMIWVRDRKTEEALKNTGSKDRSAWVSRFLQQPVHTEDHSI